MIPIDPRILAFISEHYILTLAISSDDRPYCATCFYIYLQEPNLFVFTSEPDTRHIREMIRTNNFYGSAAIALETKITGKIRGLQITGMIRKLKGEELKIAKKEFLKKFPIAYLSKLYLWGLEPEFIKMTDNRLGFGTKLIWGRIT
jgi:uncharacterized protein YhbP (UPF0306 family)